MWPMPARIDEAIWGDRFDAWTTLWLIDHLAQQISALSFSAQTTEIIYPIGYNLWSFGHMALQAMGGAMVALGVPLVVSYNLLLLLGVWTSALAAHALGRELTGSHLAGGVAGLVFATTPYLYAEAGAGCIELVAAGLLPAHALSLVRLMRAPSWRRMWWATAALAIIGPFNWYYTLFAGMFALCFVVWQIIEAGPAQLKSPRGDTQRRGITLVLLSLVAAAVLNAPLISEARRETPTRPSISAELFSAERVFDEVRSVTNGTMPLDEVSADVLSRVDAMQVHFNSTSLKSLLEPKFESNPLYSTPGAFAFTIGLFGLFLAGRRALPWATICLVTTVLTLGPFLNVSGALLLPAASSEWPLPYFWAHEYLPFFSKAYRPYRIAVLSMMCLSVIGAIGAAAWIRSRRLPPFQPPVLLLGLMAFSQPHWSGDKPAARPMASTAVDSAYTALSKLEPGAVIELPLHYQPVSLANAKTQFYQTTHGHPMLNSNQLIRWPDLLRFKQYINSNSVLKTFVNLSRKAPPHVIETADLQDLSAQGFRWIIAHRLVEADQAELSGEMAHADLLDATAWRFLDAALGEPVIDSGAVVIWDAARAVTTPEQIQEDGTSITDIPLIFDPVSTGFPLVLHPGQSTQIYEGSAAALQAWLQPISPDAAISLRIEDSGIVREVPLELVAGHWQYNAQETGTSSPLKLSLVGRGEHVSTVHITLASVSQ